MRLMRLVWPTLRDGTDIRNATAQWEALLDRLDDLEAQAAGLFLQRPSRMVTNDGGEIVLQAVQPAS